MVQPTPGILAKCGQGDDSVPNIVLQVHDVKLLEPRGSAAEKKKRWRVILSDGVHTMQAMPITALSGKFESGEVTLGCMVQLSDYSVNAVQEKKLIIIMDLMVVDGPQAIIGNPIPVGRGTSSSSSSSFSSSSAGAGGGLSRRTPSRTMSAFDYNPIASLNPYQVNWTILARVTNKSDVRHWTNARGDGKLFNIELLDAGGDAIRATFFNEAVDRFEPDLTKGCVYTFSKGRVKFAKRQFSSLKNPYEVTFGENSTIIKVDDDGSIAGGSYSFTPLSSLRSCEKNEVVDVLAVVYKVGMVESITTRAGKELSKRLIHVADQSGSFIEFTLWGAGAESFSIPEGTVIAAQGARVTDFNEKSLSASQACSIDASPDLPEARELKQWWDERGAGMDLAPISNPEYKGTMGGGGGKKSFNDLGNKVVSQIADEYLGMSQQAYFTIHATVMAIKHDLNPPWYCACPSENCNKKVEPLHGQWYCKSCDTSYESFEPRYLVQFLASDHTGERWFTGFNEVGTTLLGHDAPTMCAWHTAEDVQYERVFKKSLFKVYTIRVRAESSVNPNTGEEKIRLTAVKVFPFDPLEHMEHLQKAIAEIQ